MQQQQNSEVNRDFIDKMLMMEQLTNVEICLDFLRWVCRLSGFNKPVMSMEDAARRDIWLSIRRCIPAERLALIEHDGLKQEQQQAIELIQEMQIAEQKRQEEMFNE